MALGIVLVYLVIAALAAPLLWVIWWALDAAANGERSERMPHPHAEAAPRFAQPVPADVRLPIRRGAVAWYSAVDGSQLATCAGPDSAGRCPRVRPDGSVPCAGSVLALPVAVRGSLEWHIPAGYGACLLGSYAVLRQGQRELATGRG